MVYSGDYTALTNFDSEDGGVDIWTREVRKNWYLQEMTQMESHRILKAPCC